MTGKTGAEGTAIKLSGRHFAFPFFKGGLRGIFPAPLENNAAS